MIETGNVKVRYINASYEKMYKNSSLELSASAFGVSTPDEKTSSYSFMGTYKYTIPYKTKR